MRQLDPDGWPLRVSWARGIAAEKIPERPKMKNEWGHWYLYDGSLGPDGQMEQVRDALLTEIELKAGEGISEDVLQAGVWETLMTLVWRDEGNAGLTAFVKEIASVYH